MEMKKNQPQTNILDTAVPNIGVETLRPAPFRRRIQSLKNSAVKIENAAKKKWNKFYDWIINYVSPPERIDPSSTIQKLKVHIKNYIVGLPISKLKKKRERLKGILRLTP